VWPSGVSGTIQRQFSHLTHLGCLRCCFQVRHPILPCPASNERVQALEEHPLPKPQGMVRASRDGYRAVGKMYEVRCLAGVWKRPRSDPVMTTARGTRSGTSGSGDCWDSVGPTPSTRQCGPESPAYVTITSRVPGCLFTGSPPFSCASTLDEFRGERKQNLASVQPAARGQ